MISNKTILFLLICLITYGCTEPYILETNTYQETLVIEATITNELKKQEITLTKTSRFEDKETNIESGADVNITDDTGIQYDFKEDSGKYISTVEFQAIPGREYRLNISTNDGRTFESSSEILPPINPMQNVEAVVETKENVRGVGIHVTTEDPTGEAKYYRYTYDESYKIIAPNWNRLRAVPIPPKANELFQTFSFTPNATDTKVCYGSNESNAIYLASTVELNQNKIDFPIRFISDQNYIISHRYSILVSQYTESFAAYSYYKTLKKISDSGTLLSPLQPGFVNGNIKSTSNPSDKTLGYFDVTSVSTKRIYFNYVDLFPNEPLPPYYIKCEEMELMTCFNGVGCLGKNIANWFKSNKITFSYISSSGDLIYVYDSPCGDCTTFSSNIKPLFWKD
jgi:hypothetical protein